MNAYECMSVRLPQHKDKEVGSIVRVCGCERFRDEMIPVPAMVPACCPCNEFCSQENEPISLVWCGVGNPVSRGATEF